VARLGDDVFGHKSLENFRQVGLATAHVTVTSDAPSGVALIAVDEAGRNAIVVAPGANSRLVRDDVTQAEPDIAAAGAVVAQLEVPLDTVQYAAELAHAANVPFMLDPAPAQPLPPKLLRLVDVLTPNETEAQVLTGIDVVDEASAREAAEDLIAAGVKAAIVTMGAQGYVLVDSRRAEFVKARPIEAVDSTAAGDAFTGSLAVEMARGRTLSEAALFASSVAALSATKMGAQPSLPTRQEVEALDHSNTSP
jgi:ribokinase